MRLTDRQTAVLYHAIDAVRACREGTETARVAWIDLHEVDVPDSRLIAVRFPATCVVPPDTDEGETTPRGAIGIYVVLMDPDGNVVAASHSAGGTLTLRDGIAQPIAGTNA